MILSFGDKETEKIWNGERSSKLPVEIQQLARRKLRLIFVAEDLNDLRILLIENMSKLENIHPGEILREEFLLPLGITAYRLAKETFVSQTRISEILREKRSITADTALRFSKYFGNSAGFWLGLQEQYDLEEASRTNKKELEKIVQLER